MKTIDTPSQLMMPIRQIWDAHWFWLVPLALSTIYFGRGIGSTGLWNDEFATAFAVQGGLGEDNGEPPYLPYYSFVWLGTGLGSCTSELCLRLPSALSMMGVAVLVAMTARLVAGKWAGFAAGLIIVMAPSAQRFAQDARPFALATLLLSAATFLLVLASQGSRIWPWVAYSLSLALSGLVLPTTLAAVPAHLVLIGRANMDRQVLRRWALSLSSLIPLLALNGYWLATATTWRGQGDVFVLHHTNAWVSWYNMFTGGLAANPGVGELAATVFVLGIMTRLSLRWLSAAAISCAVIWLASFGPYSWFMGRFFMPFVGMAAVAAGIGLTRLSRFQGAAILTVLLVILLPAYTANRLPWSRGYDFRTALLIVEEDWRPGDSVIIGGDGSAGGALRYYSRPEIAQSADLETGTRKWLIGDVGNCDATQIWDLGLGNTVRLCE